MARCKKCDEIYGVFDLEDGYCKNCLPKTEDIKETVVEKQISSTESDSKTSENKKSVNNTKYKKAIFIIWGLLLVYLGVIFLVALLRDNDINILPIDMIMSDNFGAVFFGAVFLHMIAELIWRPIGKVRKIIMALMFLLLIILLLGNYLLEPISKKMQDKQSHNTNKADYICFTYMSANYKTKVSNDKWKDMYAIKVDMANDRFSIAYGDTYYLKNIESNGDKLYTHPAHDKVFVRLFKSKGNTIMQTFYRPTNTVIGRKCTLESTLK